MQSERRFQQILTIIGGFLMPLGLAMIGIGWYGTATNGYAFEQMPYLVSGGLGGLAVTIVGALVFFSSWLARLVELQRQQNELLRALAPEKSIVERTAVPRKDTLALSKKELLADR